MSNLSKAIPIRLTVDQEKALLNLKKIKINRSKFIRKAIDEKLYKDYRSLLKQSVKIEKLPF